MNEVKVGKIYRHFKGNYYYIENIAYDSETNEKVVVYRALYKDNQIWTRKEKMFLEELSDRPDNITGQKYRFQLVDSVSKDYTI